MITTVLADLLEATKNYMKEILVVNGYPFDVTVSDDLAGVSGKASQDIVVAVSLKSMVPTKTNAMKKAREVVLAVEARIRVDRATAHRTASILVACMDHAVPTWLPSPGGIPVLTYEVTAGYIKDRPDGANYLVAGIEITASYVLLSNQRKIIQGV